MMGKRFWVAVGLIGLLVLVGAIGGCGQLPTGKEFASETKPTSPSTSTEEAQPSAPGPTEGYEIYENKDPFQPRTGPGAGTAVISTPAGPTGVTVHSVTLQSISSDGTKATIVVDGTSFSDLAVGNAFAGSFQLQSIGTGSVVILYGDDTYTLYLAETLTIK